MTIDIAARRVFSGGQPLALSRSEFLTLECLARKLDRVCAKETLANAIYSFDQDWTDDAIELHAHRLRKKLASVPGAPTVKALRGLGVARMLAAEPGFWDAVADGSAETPDGVTVRGVDRGLIALGDRRAGAMAVGLG